MKPMSHAHKRHVRQNGPNQNSKDDLKCAAWLIENGFASGHVLEDYTAGGGGIYAVVWHGKTEKRLISPTLRFVVWLTTGTGVLGFVLKIALERFS